MREDLTNLISLEIGLGQTPGMIMMMGRSVKADMIIDASWTP